MGLTKQYLRYIPAGNFNIIASPGCNGVFCTLEGQEGRYVAVGACEHVIIWDLRLGEKAQVLSGETSPVTCLCASPNKRNLAVGYKDGSIQIFDLKSGEIVSIFSGHRFAITALAYDQFGHKLASGAKDTDIIIWDTVAETGVCRFTGHKGEITQLAFLTTQAIVLSSSKDTFVKFWDLDTQHCFKTLPGHQSEVWSFCLMKDESYMVTGCGDGELRVWKLSQKDDSNQNKSLVDNLATSLKFTTLDDFDDSNYGLQCHRIGSLLRQGKGRTVSLHCDESGQVLACHGTDRQIELFTFLSTEEANERLKKRIRKAKKKIKADNDENGETAAQSTDDIMTTLSLSDEVRRMEPIKLQAPPKSIDVVMGNGHEVRVVVVLNNNMIELYTTHLETEPKCLRTIAMQGHHGEVRALAFSSDNLGVASASSESVKMWNRPSQISLRTIPVDYALSVLFVPGDRHVLVGLKDGRILILDISAGDLIEEIPAHENKEVWSLCLQPDMRGVVSGGGDKTVKFWNFELITDEKNETKAKVLSLFHTRTLKLEESVLCVKISPNAKFIAVALLDSTVKIFFIDTFKFYLSLYGHKLPILCMDISSDSTLMATGSADRNVKLWGMDFGDCHKSIFAHDDSVTGLQFVPNTHYFFTCGRDGKVKQWDGDSFNKILTLQGHVGEAWSLAVSPSGQFVASCGADKVIRLYEKSDQPLVLQDEEEEEREKNEGLATGEQTVVPGQPGLKLPSVKTIGAEKAADSLIECLEVSEKYKVELSEHASLQAATTQQLPIPAPPLLMQAFNVSTPHDFLLETLRRIRASDLEEALLLLPFSVVCDLMQYLPQLVSRGDYTELMSKVIVFLLKIHHAPIVANKALLSTIIHLQKLIMLKTEELRDLIGYNYYGMQFMQNEIEESSGIRLFREATMKKKKGTKRQKMREKIKRSIMMVS